MFHLMKFFKSVFVPYFNAPNSHLNWQWKVFFMSTVIVISSQKRHVARKSWVIVIYLRCSNYLPIMSEIIGHLTCPKNLKRSELYLRNKFFNSLLETPSSFVVHSGQMQNVNQPYLFAFLLVTFQCRRYDMNITCILLQFILKVSLDSLLQARVVLYLSSCADNGA